MYDKSYAPILILLTEQKRHSVW